VPRTTHSNHAGPYSPNLLLDRPAPTRSGQVLVGDITYLALQGGEWAYMAGWLDLFSRKVSGWSVDEHMEEELVHSALQKAIAHNQLAKGSIIHSDRGGSTWAKPSERRFAYTSLSKAWPAPMRSMTMRLLSRIGHG